ncbi:unnamed protein product, partial [Didymodactylos carnosus]
MGNKCSLYLVYGLSQSGKSTLIPQLYLNNKINTIIRDPPNYIELQAFKWNIWGKWWKQPVTTKFIFVADASNNTDKLDETKCFLEQLLKNSKLKQAKILIFINKIDMSTSLKISELKQILQAILVNNEYYFQECCALS